MKCGQCGVGQESVGLLLGHWNTDCGIRGSWKEVMEARREGDLDRAERLARKAMGIQGPEMSEETKEKLRQYRELHKEEIAAKEKLKRMTKRRFRMIAKPSGKRRRK